MKRVLLAAVIVTTVACSDSTPVGPAKPLTTPPVANLVLGNTVLVTNSANAGDGSFRRAIEQANADPSITRVEFLPRVTTIRLSSTITFTGAQGLSIDGNHATLDGTSAGAAAFMVTGGGHLRVSDLLVRNAPAEGIHVEVPDNATGTIQLVFSGVEIAGNGGHGLLVNDQDDPDDVDSEGGSAASLAVTIIDSRFHDNGYTVSDRDGIRINEGGDGQIDFTIRHSRADDNAADGIELDERGQGNVSIDVFRTRITRNGVFDPLDLDDGFDIDEAGAGSILGQVVSSSANQNYEEGLDFNENGPGDLRVDLRDVEANGNREEGIDYEEDDDVAGGGHLVAVMERVTTIGNGADGGDGGLKIREKGEGDLDVTLTRIVALQNQMAGVHVRETEAGDARVRITKAVSNGNTNTSGPGHGIEIREGSSGSITVAELTHATVSNNAGFGVSVENGTATLTGVSGGGNGLGLNGGGATFIVVP